MPLFAWSLEGPSPRLHRPPRPCMRLAGCPACPGPAPVLMPVCSYPTPARLPRILPKVRRWSAPGPFLTWPSPWRLCSTETDSVGRCHGPATRGAGRVRSHCPARWAGRRRWGLLCTGGAAAGCPGAGSPVARWSGLQLWPSLAPGFRLRGQACLATAAPGWSESSPAARL